MRPNQRVTLELTDSEPVVRYHSRIEGVDVDCLLLAAPIHQGRTVALSVGTKLRVTLFHNGGAHAFETAVVGREGFPVPLLRVERPIRMEALQRRQFFREPAVVRSLCSLTRSGRSEIQGVTRNIGGGG